MSRKLFDRYWEEKDREKEDIKLAEQFISEKFSYHNRRAHIDSQQSPDVFNNSFYNKEPERLIDRYLKEKKANQVNPGEVVRYH